MKRVDIFYSLIWKKEKKKKRGILPVEYHQTLNHIKGL